MPIADDRRRDLLRFLSFLEATESEHELGSPADGVELAPVPAPLRPFYQRINGAALFDGDLLFFAAGGPPDEDGTVQHASRLARGRPNGPFRRRSSCSVGTRAAKCWASGPVPRDAAKYPSPVVLTGLLFQPAAHALLATSFERYLLTTTVWHCFGTELADTAFPLFHVPRAIAGGRAGRTRRRGVVRLGGPGTAGLPGRSLPGAAYGAADPRVAGKLTGRPLA